MVLAYLHLINILSLAATAWVYHRMPRLLDDQAAAFLALAGLLLSSMAVIVIGLWAMATRQSSTGKVAMHSLLVLCVAAGAGFYAYRVGVDYHLIDYMRGKLR